MNSGYFVTKISSSREQTIFLRGRTAHQKCLVVRVDKWSVQTSRASTSWLEEHGVRHILYQPYSPDLARSGFYLLPTVKEKLERIQVRQEEQVFEWLRKIIEASTTKN
jgi:hypothetical protein